MFERIKKQIKREKGFTLVELLAVIAILGIIVAIAVPTIGNVVSDSKTKADTANKELFESAARLANASEGTEEVNRTLGYLQKNGYLDEIPVIPGGDSKYQGSVKQVTENDTTTYTFVSSK